MSRGPGGARLVPLTIEGPAGGLEALLQEHGSGAHAVAALVLHPHPLYGGTMHNKVVHRTAAVLHTLGAAVLRFNFRGVEKSAGRHDRGEGEVEDARAALRFLAERNPGARLWLAGFSFGSWIAARLAAAGPGVERLILVAPPVTSSSFEVLHTLRIPKLVLQGANDVVCPPDALRAEFTRWAEPRTLIEIPGASHFFDRQLGALADAMREALLGAAGSAASSIT